MTTDNSTTDSSVRPPKLPLGVSGFDELIREGYTFVDKTLLIKKIIEDGTKVNVITRPRRFGKTLNLSMLHHFFAAEVIGRPTAGLFDGLSITNDLASMAYQGQYPVIFFTFKDMKERQFETAVDKLRAEVARLFRGYPELVDSPHLAAEQKADIAALRAGKASVTELGDAFKTLTQSLYLHYQQKVWLFIDEYDTPIQAAYLHGFYQEMVDLMRDLLSGGLKDNSYLYKSVVTGILRVSKESLFSGVNNLKVRTVLDEPYSRYFGFTEPEVAALFETLDPTLRVNQALEPVKTWYNGYHFDDTTVYNPWSIINCLEAKGACRPYWVNTSDNALLKKLMAQADADVKQALEQLLQGRATEQLIDPNIVFGDLDQSVTAQWSLLLFSGYLTATDARYDEEARATCRLQIPNLEVQGLYKRHIKDWFSDTMGEKNYSDFLNCLVTGRLEEFELRLKEYLAESASYFDAKGRNPEKFYHGLVLGLIAGLKETHLIYSNRESGYGRYDIAIIPRGGSRDDLPGIIMEFKRAANKKQLEQEAENALAQIERRWYQAELKQHRIEHLLTIGMAFSGKRVAIRHSG